MAIKSKLLPIALYGTLFIICIYAWRGYSQSIDSKIAWGGLSPVGMINESFYPENFIKNFPSGIENYYKSAFMHIYKLAYKYLGISPEQLLPVVIGFEIIVLACAVHALCRTLLRDAPVFVPVIVVILSIFSNTSYMNLSRIQFNHFYGLYYPIADALQIFAISMFLKNRTSLGFILLAGVFITHPIKGLIALIFIFAMHVYKPQELFQKKTLKGAIPFLIITGIWMFVMFEPATFSVNTVPEKVWFDLTRLNGVHWYPVASGLFSTEHQICFVPFLSFLLLLVFYINRRRPLREIDKKVIAGMCAAAFLTIAGIAISVLTPNPALVKLSLHRASELIIIIGIVYIANGLWSEMEASQNWRKAIAALILISPFILSPGFPILFSVLLTASAWLPVPNGRRLDKGNLLVAILAVGSVLLLAAYSVMGIAREWTNDAYTGVRLLSLLHYGVVFLMLVIIFLGNLFNRKLAYVVVISLIVYASVIWVINRKPSADEISKAKSYKEVQIWAKEYSAGDALFMIDPSIYYGWRDYSQRSSFGAMREWLYSSWCYDSNYEIYKEGLKRFNEFNISLDRYLHIRPSYAGFEKLNSDIKEKYYLFGDDWRLYMAEKYDVDYFVMNKNDIKKSSNMPVVYENSGFVVLKADNKN